MSQKKDQQNGGQNNQPNYKDTINLPKTDFPMKGNLSQREPEFIQKWLSNKIYFKMINENSEKGSFTMPDGPPYANGHIHVGHALNKILKDTVIKYKNMSGYKAPFIPGWDCHGLPIELGVTKSIGEKKKAELTDKQFRNLCREEAKKWINLQREEFKRIGVLADWDNPYMTMQSEYEAEEVRVLAQILKTGAFYHGTKPVYWCWALRTALAEAEVEYHNHKSPAIYVKFETLKHLDVPNKNKKVNLVIWTTTPWTLPANLAVSAHPEFNYEVYETEGDYLVIAQDLKDAFEKDTGILLKSLDTPKVFVGADLEGLEYKHPFIERIGKVLLGTHVTSDAGTGLVHTAPGHGVDDYNVGMKYHLPILSPVDGAGLYTNEAPEFLRGKHVLKEGNKLVLEKIKNSGHLLHLKEIEHTYPYCWRSKTPLIFRATPQWFLKMDLKGNNQHTVRENSLNAIKKVTWVPSWGEKRISSMIENRPDWCLSRQRLWGVPIPVLFCKDCQHPLAKEDVMMRVAEAMEKGGGIEGYFDTDIHVFAGNHKCENCGSSSFEKGKDILDVWFDSGVCWAAVQKKRDGLTQPADLYLEGSDQHRGWFHTSLLASVAAEGIAPFKTVLTHGFVMFAKGQKMSKSLGNVVDPMEVIKSSGSDILRLWATHEDYANDLSCNPESLTRITETYRRLRNTIRFLLGNLYDYDHKKDALPYKDLTAIDQWALSKLNVLIENVTEGYEKYEFYKIYHLINNFVTVDLSSFYLDILKDRLYIRKANGHLRRSAQTALYEITTTLSKMMAPIASFLAEETYSFTLGKEKDSVFLEKFPSPNKTWRNLEVLNTFETFQKIRTEALKKLEELRKNKVIGSGLEAQLIITAEGEDLKVLELLKESLLEFFIVSQVHLKKGPFAIEAKKAEGEKCVRCWTYNLDLNSSSKFPGLCPRCVEALT